MKQLNLIIIIIFLATLQIQAQETNIENGERVFKASCSACHKPERRLIGPPLKGVAAKYKEDFGYITSFVHNSQEVIQSGDQRAVAIFAEYNQQVMTPFPTITEAEVKDILAYADSFVLEEDPNQVKLRPLPPVVPKTYRPLNFKQNLGTWTFYFLGVILLVSTLYMLTVYADFNNQSNKKEE